jgi:hypothetical protein
MLAPSVGNDMRFCHTMTKPATASPIVGTGCSSSAFHVIFTMPPIFQTILASNGMVISK